MSVSAAETLLTGIPFANQYMIKPPGGIINYIYKVCLYMLFEDCQTIVSIYVQLLWKSIAYNLLKIEYQVLRTQCKETNL